MSSPISCQSLAECLWAGHDSGHRYRESARIIGSQDFTLQWMVRGDMDVAPMISTTGKKSDLKSHRLIEGSPTEAEMQGEMVNMQQMLIAYRTPC